MPLESLFRAMYHDKFDFQDFVNGEISRNYERTQYLDREKTREILKPNQKLKTFHTFLNLFLFEHLPVNRDVVFSYRKGVSTYDAVIPHAKSRHFFQADISSFFTNINREMVNKTISFGYDSVPISDIDFYKERILDLVCVGDTLPTGFPTSPTITNAVLRPFDDQLQAYCNSNSAIYTRYSDDIIISALDRELPSDIKDYVTQTLSVITAGRLQLNERKCRHFHIGGKVKILGMLILPNGQISVDSKIRRETETLLYFYVRDKDKFLNKTGLDFDKGMKRVSGFLNYINTIDQRYLEKLRRKYGATVIDMFLHRSFD
ncbi:Retron-type reverse transcriptase [Thiocystis violascens DSM 198]|uniref:RNA-directed DNA polymerase n=2 Tax=Thiocystis violascens TaxID=73141 RepID=I3Y9G8_THIV6|nr:Retron-type reverse transcriptase [Thiocystis violascens DSM 198]